MGCCNSKETTDDKDKAKGSDPKSKNQNLKDPKASCSAQPVPAVEQKAPTPRQEKQPSARIAASHQANRLTADTIKQLEIFSQTVSISSMRLATLGLVSISNDEDRRAADNDDTPSKAAWILFNQPQVSARAAVAFVTDGRCGLGRKSVATDDIHCQLSDLSEIYNRPGCTGSTPLLLAIFANRFDIVQGLLAEGASVNERIDEVLYTALHIATRHVDPSIAQALCDLGADVEALGCSSETPLHSAACMGHEANVDLLLSEGADPFTIYSNSALTLRRVCSGRNFSAGLIEKVVKLTDVDLATAKGDHVLCFASSHCRPIAVRILASYGAAVDCINKRSQTPLHLSCRYTRNMSPINVLTLLAHGADIAAKDMYGDTALHHTARTNATILMNLLLDEGSPINEMSKEMTPLHLALLAGSEQAARILISRKANLTALCKCGATVLHYAAGFCESLVAELLMNGLDASAVDQYGRTPLHMAASQGKVEAMKLLLATGVAVDAVDVIGRTALHLSTECGTPNGFKLLIERGSDITLKDKLDRTPHQLANNVGMLGLPELQEALGDGQFQVPFNTAWERHIKLILERQGAAPRYNPMFWFTRLTNYETYLLAEEVGQNQNSPHKSLSLHRW